MKTLTILLSSLTFSISAFSMPMRYHSVDLVKAFAPVEKHMSPHFLFVTLAIPMIALICLAVTQYRSKKQ